MLNKEIVLYIQSYKSRYKIWIRGFLTLLELHQIASVYRGITSDLDIDNIFPLGGYVDKQRIVYSAHIPFYKIDVINYVVAHETAHVQMKDDINNRGYLLRFFVNIMLFLVLTGLRLLPLVALLPVYDYLIYLAYRRYKETMADVLAAELSPVDLVLWSIQSCEPKTRETMADVLAAELSPVDLVLWSIQSCEPKTRFGWLFYGHATTKSFMRMYRRKYKMKEWKLVETFKLKGHTCVIVKCVLESGFVFHNGYVSVNKDIDTDKIQSVEITYTGTLERLGFPPDMNFIGFDTAHLYNFEHPKSRTARAVKRSIKELVKEIEKIFS